MAGPALVAAAEYILLGTSTTVAVRYFAFFLSVQIFISVATILTWVGNTHAMDAMDAKRGGAFAILATGGQCGPVLGTNIFPKTNAPYCRKGMWISCGACLLANRRDRKYGKDGDWNHLDSGAGMGDDDRSRYVI